MTSRTARIVAVAWGVVSYAAWAEGASEPKLNVIDNNQTQSFDCKAGDSAEIAGNDNHITLTGTCHRLVVSGNGNRVRIDGAIEQIEAIGNRNEVVWSASRNTKRPRITNPGTGNKLGSDAKSP
jgi:hypothetical protein